MKMLALLDARLKRHWTLAKAAEAIGVDINTLSRWERGISFPHPYNRKALCDAYGTTEVELGLSDELPAQRLKPALTLVSTTPIVVESESADIIIQESLKQNPILRFYQIISDWPVKNTSYSELQALITQATEDYGIVTHNNSFLTRRDALRQLALMPIQLCGLSTLGAVLTKPIEEILMQCAAGITACWYLRKGKGMDLTLASSVVAAYIPTLKSIATNALLSQHRNNAIDLFVQCLLLQATLSRHVEHSNNSVKYAQQAAKYSASAENPTLSILALRTLAANYYYANNWEQALQTAEQAKFRLEQNHGYPVPKLAASYVYAGLATYQARIGQEREAHISLRKAHEEFHTQATDEQVPIWIDHNAANLWLNDGKTHFHLGSQKYALLAFAQLHTLPVKTELIRVETFTNELMAELQREDKLRDMDWCIERWKKSIEGAQALKSELRFEEAVIAYNVMLAAWPGEKRIKDLRELIGHW